MVPISEGTSPQGPQLGFSVSHQKVELDIDFFSRSLRGKTALIINPHSRDLRVLRLNCRQIELKGLTVNGKPVPGVKYVDPYERSTLRWKASVYQYHMLQERLEKAMRRPPEEELLVTLPKSVKLEELDPYSEDAQTLLLSKTLGGNKRDSDTTAIDLTQGTRTGIDQTARFTPITLSVEYEIKRLRDGMQFVGFEDGDLRYPHMYTTNSPSPGSACCLFPCLDDLTSRCTWEISIKCSKTIGDAFHSLKASRSRSNGVVNGAVVSHGASEIYGRSELFNSEDEALELTVVCTGDMTDEIVDAQDPTKKTTSFICTNAISAQHVGFAIGPFEHVNLAGFREDEEDDRLGQNAVPVHGFCLPGRIEETKNTCLPLAKAVDFFTITYGSYPYSNYKLCFVDESAEDILHTGSFSLCSSRLLFPEDVLEPIDRVTRQIVHAVATQWIGIDIVAKEPEDTWVIVGIAYYITDIFMRRLCGKNEYRYNQKRAADRVVELDVDRPSLMDIGALVDLDPSEIDFVTLKAPLVLFVLDQRMMKAGTSTGLSRIISRIFLSARVGDLPNGSLDTAYFVKICERLSHAKLEPFFAQWVEGAGCPKFRVQQRFNKKKLVVEMSVHQVQGENVKEKGLESATFLRDVKEEAREVYAGPIQPCFTGPMTIRIHEADGTPYEHIVEIKEPLQKFEIPYNTKYKRLKRSRRQKEKIAAVAGAEFAGDGTDDVLLYSLGDVLQTEEEMKKWQLAEWTPDDEERMSQESYEWIRMDADFEWICKMSLTMPGYMWVSQLQQDRDVVAQLESIQYLEIQKAHPLISAFLVRTLMDQRYFHGIRTAATKALAKCAKDDVGWIGLFHLEKAFQDLYCYSDSTMTRPNDFSSRAAYLVQCAIPEAVAEVRDVSGRANLRVRRWLFEKLRFNDNSNNEFSDCHYVAVLMRALAYAMSSKPAPTAHESDDFEDDSGDDLRFHEACLEEIDRHRRIDEWIPSYQNVISRSALDCKRMLGKAHVTSVKAVDFLQYTPDGTSILLRLNAFANLMELGMAKHDAILRWFLFVLGTDPSAYMREHMLRIFGKTLGAIAIGESSEPAAAQVPQDGLIIEQEASTEARKADLARKQTVVGALDALKNELASNTVLQQGLWTAIISPNISLQQMWQLLEICDRLYTPHTSIVVALKLPRYWKCKRVGRGKVVFSQTDRIRDKPLPKRPVKLKLSSTGSGGGSSNDRGGGGAGSGGGGAVAATSTEGYPFLKRQTNSSSGAMGAAPPRTLLKPPKPPGPPLQHISSAPRMGNGPESTSQASDGGKPKLKIKLKFGAGSGGGGAGSPQ
ncbi:MAG: hypothetical protein Q9217_004698 [Psora testacea]